MMRLSLIEVLKIINQQGGWIRRDSNPYWTTCRIDPETWRLVYVPFKGYHKKEKEVSFQINDYTDLCWEFKLNNLHEWFPPKG